MKQPQISSARHLRPIPANTVVHTPTEEEAKELLAILHEDGYKWSSDAALTGVSNFHVHNGDTCYCLEPPYVTFRPKNWFIRKGYIILTLAEFKEKYVIEEEKPQPKFNKGQLVRITNKKHPHFGHKGKVGEVISYYPEYDRYSINGIPSVWESGDLAPYTEPETKEETMETKEETIETKELNLCELLREGDIVYSLIDGEGKVELLDENGFRLNTWAFRKDGSLCGCDSSKAKCLIYPSRALYEQYPLDAYAAWMKWKEEQTIYHIRIEFQPYDERGEMKCGNMGTLNFDDLKFRTPADRDKCISEIKTIIEKYSK